MFPTLSYLSASSNPFSHPQVLAEIAFAKKRIEDRKVLAKEKRKAEMVSRKFVHTFFTFALFNLQSHVPCLFFSIQELDARAMLSFGRVGGILTNEQEWLSY